MWGLKKNNRKTKCRSVSGATVCFNSEGTQDDVASGSKIAFHPPLPSVSVPQAERALLKTCQRQQRERERKRQAGLPSYQTTGIKPFTLQPIVPDNLSIATSLEETAHLACKRARAVSPESSSCWLEAANERASDMFISATIIEFKRRHIELSSGILRVTRGQ